MNLYCSEDDVDEVVNVELYQMVEDQDGLVDARHENKPEGNTNENSG